MNKRIRVVILVLAVFFLLVALTACDSNSPQSDDELKVVALAIDISTLPAQVTSGAVDFSGIKLNVYYSNGDSVGIPVSEDMVAVSDRIKLSRSGRQTISIIYEGQTAKMDLLLVAPDDVIYKVTVKINKPASDETGVSEYVHNVLQVTYDPLNPDSNVRTISAPNFTSEGFAFSYWKEGGETISTQLSTNISVTQDRTITAYYTEMQYKVSFNAMGGSDISQMETREITYENMPVPTRENYVFTGWRDIDLSERVEFTYTGTDITRPSKVYYTSEPFTYGSQYVYTVRKNVSLEAQWEPLGLIFKEDNSGYAIVGYEYTGNRTYLDIPASHKGLPILKLSATAFGKENSDGSYDYASASKLTSIRISRNIEQIEPFTFSNCISLTSIQLDAANNSFSISNGALYGAQDILLAYPPGRMAATYNVGNTSRIAAGAFENANIGSINVSNVLIELGDRAFNSRTVDNVNFNGDISSTLSHNISELFHENISKIFVGNSTYKAAYAAHPAFAPYADKITEISEGITHVGVYQNFLYRRLDSTERKLEIIGVNRSLATITVPVVPVDNYFFTSIGKYAFSYCYGLSTFNLPQEAGIERILEGAFDNTAWQKNAANSAIRNGLIIINNILYLSLNENSTVNIPSNVIRIAEASFINKPNLTKIVFEKQANNTQVSAIARYAFANCTKLIDFTLPKTVKSIGEYAFFNVKLNNFVIENNSVLERIGAGAFHNATGLTALNFTSAIKEIADGAFAGCISLEAINVPVGGNGYFKSVDGILYKYDRDLAQGVDEIGQILHTYPSAKMLPVYEVAAGTTKILDYAFYYANIGALKIPSAVNAEPIDIGKNAIVIPQLVYIEFNRAIPNETARWDELFGRDLDGNRFTPHYIFLEKSDNKDYRTVFMQGAPTTLKLTKWEDAGVNYNNVDFSVHPDALEIVGTEYMLYLDREIPIGGIPASLSIIGAKRTVAALAFEEEYSTASIVSKYAFVSVYLTSVTLSSSVNKIEAYAFYYSTALEKITLKSPQPPTLYYDANDDILSFAPSIIVNSALVYVPVIALDEYIQEWPVDESFILAEGTHPTVQFYVSETIGLQTYNEENAVDFQLTYNEQIITSLPIVSQAGYDFDGWFEDAEYIGEKLSFPYRIYKNVTLYAKWNLKEFKINYQLGGGYFPGDYNEYVIYDTNEALTVPEKAGFEFLGWYSNRNDKLTEPDGRPVERWSMTAELTVIARWSYQKYTLTYETGGGSVEQPSLIVNYNTSFVAHIPTKVGYVFEGWALENGEFLTFSDGASINTWQLSEDISVFAVWSGQKYNAIFTPDLGEGVSVNPTVVQVVYNEHFVLPIPVGKAGFLGWFDGEGGTGNQYTDASGNSVRKWDKTSSAMLYPQWPTEIFTYNELNAIRESPEKGYVLKNDIEMPIGEFWTPIPQFRGILDGGHYTIKNLKIAEAYQGIYGEIDAHFAGLIAINNGTVKNLKIGVTYSEDTADYSTRAGIDVEVSERAFVGGIAAVNAASGVIIDCEIAVIISVQSETSDIVSVGAAVGYNAGRIQDVKLVTKITTEKSEGTLYSGTLVGEHVSGGIITGCHFERYNPSGAETKPYGNQGEANTGSYESTSGNTIATDWLD